MRGGRQKRGIEAEGRTQKQTSALSVAWKKKGPEADWSAVVVSVPVAFHPFRRARRRE